MQKTDLAQKYQHKTAREHCLDAPDTYIGSVEEEEQETRSLSALEEDMKNERAQGIMVTPDMEGMDPADIKKAKVKKDCGCKHG